ncbi:hypothetical protein [Psychroserpens damuponensis]|uniref:hypothetical protein n=1 Tax=Psychroserpens damuponensis TaxID=943936 RepID=UPI000694D9FE|nr:hypothetical protein [Psychroserpens damuponensis]
MKKHIILLFFSLFALQVFAQPDTNEKKSIKIPAKETKKKDTASVKLDIKPNSKLSITKTKKNISGISVPKVSKESITKPKKEFSMIHDNGLKNPGDLFEAKFNKVAVEQGLKIETMADVFLGEIKSNGAFVRIVCRDHEFPDGDVVQVKVNDDIIVPRLLLTGGYKGFNVDLNVGSNKIEFIALNQGDSGPNTAEFIVYDDNGNLVSSKKWNLLTGVKATVIVLKDANPITEKEPKRN